MNGIIPGILGGIALALALDALHRRRTARLIARERAACRREAAGYRDQLLAMRRDNTRLACELAAEREARTRTDTERAGYDRGYTQGARDAQLLSDSERFATALANGNSATIKLIRRQPNVPDR